MDIKTYQDRGTHANHGGDSAVHRALERFPYRLCAVTTGLFRKRPRPIRGDQEHQENRVNARAKVQDEGSDWYKVDAFGDKITWPSNDEGWRHVLEFLERLNANPLCTAQRLQDWVTAVGVFNVTEAREAYSYSI